MDVFVNVVLFAALIAVSLLIWLRERKARQRIAEEKDAIEVEERRMFGFLHGLGERLQEDSAPSSLHRYIVEGVAEVVEADAGILYLLAESSGHLFPAYHTDRTSPVVPVPDEVLAIDDPAEAAKHYRSFIRLSALEPSGTLIGQVFSQGDALHIENLDEVPEFAPGAEQFQRDVALLAAPLVYGRKQVGVLAVTRHGGAPFSRNDEEVFASVAEQGAFALGSALIHIEAAEKRRYERELTQASEIQRVLLPKAAPALVDYSLAAEYRAARLVSGDYYDYVRVDEDRYGIAIGDVCGKGIAASLIMAMCRSNLRSHARDNLSPATVLHEVNRSIFPDIKEDMFVSLLYLILERGSNEITMARAGHEPPLLFRQSTGEIESIETGGLAAGVDRGPVFKRSVKDFRFTMEKGDVLVLYTDGLTESENRAGDEFGNERLLKTIRDHGGGGSPEELVRAIIAALESFNDGLPLTDDITLIAIGKR